jgi:hypothetical protein
MVLSLPSTPFAGALRRGAAGTALAALAALLPGTARAVAPPDSGQLEVLGARCDSAGLVRVVTHQSARLVKRVRLEADAVVLPGLKGRVALIQVGQPPETRDTRIPWSDVEGLSIGESRTARGFLTGAVVGALAGGGIVALGGPDLVDRGDNAVLAFGVLVGLGFTTLGTLLGAANPRWHSVYP